MRCGHATRSGITPGTTDLFLGAGLFAVAVLSGMYLDSARPDTVRPDQWWQWLLLVTPALTVVVRRLDPVAATVVATLAQVLIWTSDLPEFLLALVVVLYTAASDGELLGVWAAVVASVVLTSVTAIGLVIAGDVSVYQVPLVALTCATAIVLGLHAKRQRWRASELSAQVTEARLLVERERDQAVTNERAAIARELHDIIGHSLATIAVRAEAADRVAMNQPAVATEALSAIAGAARSSLDETRRVLAGLRVSESAELSPTPDLAAVRALIARTAEAGAAVSIVDTGCDESPPPAMVMSGAYRIVQESLTNAIRHGGPSPTITVEIDCSPERLTIVVVNTVSPVSAGPGVVAAAITGQSSHGGVSGTGVRGMAERAHVLGGTFETIDAGRSFTVQAELPTRNRHHA